MAGNSPTTNMQRSTSPLPLLSLLLLLLLLLQSGIGHASSAANSNLSVSIGNSRTYHLCTINNRYECQQSCFALGRRLAVLADAAANMRVAALLAANNISRAFFGLDQQSRAGHLHQSDGNWMVQNGFNRWFGGKNGRPQQLSAFDNCATIDSQGQWRLERCTSSMPSICEDARDVNAPALRWTAWCNVDRDQSDDDNEGINFARIACSDICNDPFAWKCRVARSEVASNSTGQNFMVPCSRRGLVCRNADNVHSTVCNDYEVAYLCPVDFDECAAKEHSCDINAKCINTPGSYTCRCNPGYVGDGYSCKYSSTCNVFGGVHVITFDGAHLFGGSSCGFVLAETCNSNVNNKFRVQAQQTRISSAGFGIASVIISVYDFVVIMSSSNQVTINSIPVTLGSRKFKTNSSEVSNQFVMLLRNGADLSMEADFGLLVRFNPYVRSVSITLPRNIDLSICGLCGNADGVRSNDYSLKGFNSTTSDKFAIYRSWMSQNQKDSSCKTSEIVKASQSPSLPTASLSAMCKSLLRIFSYYKDLSDLSITSIFNDACYADLNSPVNNLQICHLTLSFHRVLASRGLISAADALPQGICSNDAVCGDNEEFITEGSDCEESCSRSSGSTCRFFVPGCKCKNGYLRSGSKCIIRNECGCHDEQAIYREKGEVWYTDNCKKKHECISQEKILLKGNSCQNNSMCTQLPNGDGFCNCTTGYEGAACDDIDECARTQHKCSEYATCLNTQGAYSCRCGTGFVGNGFNCTDIDECTNSPCSNNAQCHNTKGSYICACKSPYVGNGKLCHIPFITPHNVSTGCSSLKELHCHKLAICSDQRNGSISCSCPHGAIGDGYLGSGHSGCAYANCPNGYKQIEGFCYKFDSTPRNHSAAVIYCATLGGMPATIANDLIASEVKLLLPSPTVKFWTGYADAKTSGIFPPMDFVGSKWRNKWIVGDNKNSDSPAVGSYKPQFCASASVDAGEIKLQPVLCSTSQSTVCKVPGSARSCPDGWQSFGKNCYFTSTNKTTFENALFQCALLGSDLASVPDNSISKFLFDHFLNSGPDSQRYWLGLQNNTLKSPGSFSWWDGTKFDANYQMWQDSAQLNSNRDCTAITGSARWVTRNCYEKLGYVCQKQRWAWYRCPRNAYYFNGKCYSVQPVAQNFTAHLSQCRRLGGDLISFQTAEEYHFFRDIIYKGQSGPKAYYAGLFLPVGASGFVNSDGDQVKNYKWQFAQPINASLVQKCTQISDPALGLIEVNCSSESWAVCEFENTPCQSQSECAKNGECFLGQCRCKKGYYGDGRRSCQDVNECVLEGICQKNSYCTNLDGDYNCTCDSDYELNAERKCQHKRYCVKNSDCLRNAKCSRIDLCVCNAGFSGDGKRVCSDIDECVDGSHKCSTNATCSNTNGGYKCKCNNGFEGNGLVCDVLPRNCHELRLMKPKEKFKARSWQTIDPDGTGSLNALRVICEMHEAYGITVFPPKKHSKSSYKDSRWRDRIVYDDNIQEMIAVVDSSAFCLQEIKYHCSWGASTASDINYYDRNMTARDDWGSGTSGQCLCGIVGLCKNKESNCNCNGDPTVADNADYGYIMNKNILPVRGFKGKASRGKGTHIIGDLRCSGVQFGIPSTCEDHPENKDSNVHLIDPDQSGELEPFPVLCFNPSCHYKSVAVVTVVSHNNFDQRCSYNLQKSVVNGDNALSYCGPVQQLNILKQKMAFCSQEIRYDCKNSRIITAGNENTHFYTSNRQPIYNLGFGSPRNQSCPCAAVNKCKGNKACNCDSSQDGWTFDFGWVLDKNQLPIMGLQAQGLGGNSQGNVSVGYFACSSQQFGIMGNCQMYRSRYRADDDSTFILRNYKENYVYPIDPDLKQSRVQPFPVYCEMKEKSTGVTVIPNLAAGSGACSKTTSLCEVKAEYAHSQQQIAEIVKRSSYCTQTITYQCRNSPILLAPNESVTHAYWKSLSSETKRFGFAKSNQLKLDSGIGCGCTERGVPECVANKVKCVCDLQSNTTASENIVIDDKNILPVQSMFVSGEENFVQFGDMMCYDIPSSCYNRLVHSYYLDIEEQCIYARLGSTFILPNHEIGGFNPLEVICNHGGETEVQITKKCRRTTLRDVDPESKEQCYEVQYGRAGEVFSKDQIRFLTHQSKYCIQYANYVSKHTAFTNHVRWTGISGSEQTHWAGTLGKPGCACGINGFCQQNTDLCNTDSANATVQQDRGWFVSYMNNGDAVPIVKICSKLSSHTRAETNICFDSLRCMETTQYRIPKHCQDARDRHYLHAPHAEGTEAWLINPQEVQGKKPALATCSQTKSPPVGVTIIGRKTCHRIGQTGGRINLTYSGFPDDQIQSLIQKSTYCTQKVEFKCKAANFSGINAALDNNGNPLKYWGDNQAGTGCKGGCNCDGSASWNEDTAIFTDKNVLPLSSIQLESAGSGSEREICVHELHCYQLYTDCESYYNSRGYPAYPNGRSELAIDVDQAGPLDPVSVKCDITKCRVDENKYSWMGVTSLYLNKFYGTQSTIFNANSDRAEVKSLNYLTAVAQATKLADKSGQCWQLVHAHSKKSGLLASGVRLSDRTGMPVLYFSGSDMQQVNGCACKVLGTCPNGTSCHSDKTGVTEELSEGTYVINKAVLPILRVMLPKIITGAELQIYIETMSCAPKFCALPRHCSEVRKRDRRTSFEQWIQPGSTPFLVLCEPGKHDWVTRVITKVTDRNSSGIIQIQYPTASVELVQSLVNILPSCTQAVRVTCRKTAITSNNAFAFISASGVRSKLFAAGQEKCSCGLRRSCQGSDLPAQIRQRSCSCDIGDDVQRVDSGVFLQDSKSKANLPVAAIDIGQQTGSSIWQLSDLYCGQKRINIDECELGLHDCDPNADCSQVGFNSHDCECRKGWQGKGVPGVVANGRQCFDDNECALGMCGKNTICVNMPGTYRCDCESGYQHSSPTECVDINECSTNTHNCDTNALCINLQGSFMCVCKPGYDGSGSAGDCREIGSCTCWGDPHCRSFDSRLLHYQGACSYILARDSCANGSATAVAPQWQVVQKNWRKGRRGATVSWTKEILVEVFGKKILLRQGMRVVLDGQQISLPAMPQGPDGNPLGVEIRFFENVVLLKTRFGLQVKWDGNSRVEVVVDAVLKGTVCGLCGDYNGNAQNDWILGPLCEPSSQITKSARLFGDSWRIDRGLDEDECSPSCSDIPDPQCTGDKFESSKTKCERLANAFSNCAAEMVKFGESIDIFLATCTFDLCLGGASICDTANTLSSLCQSRFNVTTAWRSASFCPMTCGKNMHYEKCASPCQATCTQPNMTSSARSGICAGKCTEACVCNEGFLLSAGGCLRESECGCQISGLYYDIGDSIVKPNCTQKCTCDKAGDTSLKCSAYTCSEYAFCGFKNDSYDCHCRKGFKGNGTICDDINECAENPSSCSPQATCTNTVGSFECKCKTGWQGDGFVCDDINECEKSPCNEKTEECFNLLGSYQCRCKDGFFRNFTTKQCEDKNECLLNQHRCHKSSTDCYNTFGGYNCTCKSGYERVNEFTCRDIDECLNVSSNNCHSQYATCTNSPGSYACNCNVGFTGNGVNCTDANECDNPHACYLNATCTNTVGSYFCTCDTGNRGCTGPDPCLDVKCNGSHVNCYRGVCYCTKGFQKNITTGLCADENECSTGNNNCSAINAFCMNTFGSHECQCLPGFIFNEQSHVCEDIDECKENKHDCRNNAVCKNHDGGYTCECETGFMGHCEECRDIDECDFNLHECDKKFANCTNTIGSYTCVCSSGFIGNGRICMDIDECISGQSNCPSDSTCINTPGSYNCHCSPGYMMSANGECVDYNECLTSNNDCSISAKCTNTKGSYTCQCIPGYSGDGFNCSKDHTKIDCNGVACHAQAMCDDGKCKCLGGYRGNGVSCTDIDECSEYPGLCDKSSVCYNTPGSFSCQCNEGLSGNGFVCINDSSTIAPCMRSDVCINGICTDLPDDKYSCICYPGYELKDQRCIDVNECEVESACSLMPQSHCVNVIGSYSCKCDEGYQLQIIGNEHRCVNINECELNPYACGSNTECIDTDGSFTCICEAGTSPVSGSSPFTCKPGGSTLCDRVTCVSGAYCTEEGKCVCVSPYYELDSTRDTPVCKQVIDPCQNAYCPDNATCRAENAGVGCYCNSGFELVEGGTCEDIRECDNPGLHNCDSSNSRCVETVGSYRCECIEGYRADAEGQCISENPCECGKFGICLRNSSCWCRPGFTEVNGKCVDVDECLANQQPCHELAQCHNTIGTYICRCPENFVGDGYNFCDLDECSLGIHSCAEKARCTNTLGSYRCDCLQGFIGDGRECIEGTNPCLFKNGNCGDSALCTWSNNQVTCQCPSGFRGNGMVCYDINECSEGLHNCHSERGTCMNTAGSFVCQCKQGYQGNGVRCEDIDECLTDANNCHVNAKCNNKNGSFECKCKAGFSGDGVATCNLVGDCRYKNICHEKAQCKYTVDGYSCLCREGYEGNGIDSCEDINECELGTHSCASFASCINSIGSYRCLCNPGFVGNGRKLCHDINECLTTQRCNNTLTQCVNIPGSYSCPCVAGAQFNGETNKCEDINECESDALNKCSTHATCTNEVGSFQCKCKTGFFGDGVTCQDLNECLSGTSNCDQNAICVNTPGSFDCKCRAGLIGNGTLCKDENECDKTNPKHECHENATCINTQPGYRCECLPGFIGSGFFCLKTNPCNKPGICNSNATCTYDGISTHCVCKNGFKGDGVTNCIAANQCIDGSHNCDPISSTCEANSVGFSCKCKPGFHKEGLKCVDNDECDPSSIYFKPDACGNSFFNSCNNTIGGYACVCSRNATQQGAQCVPVNRCAVTKACSAHAKCISEDGELMCQCNSGYIGNGVVCKDVNECEIGNHDCNDPALCVNTDGSYECQCPSGYISSNNGRSCNDINECQKDAFICGNYSNCLNTQGSYKCDCISGWIWNPITKKCEDKNECKTDENPCHPMAECINTPGSCTCKCRNGYNGDGMYFCELAGNCTADITALCPANSICRTENGKNTCYCSHDQLDIGENYCNANICIRSCKSVDACWTRAPRCSAFAKCKTINDEARCVCNEGFSGNGIICRDVNECLKPNECDSAISSCRNLDNTKHSMNYTCDCKSGYQLITGTRKCININECELTPLCLANAKCVDTPGSFRCSCKTGYRPVNATACTDINECDENIHDCDSRTALCKNTIGGFVCQCKPGLELLNRTHCQDINECSTVGACGIEQNCHNVFGSYACACPLGFTAKGIYCLDVDECAAKSACHESALCYNTRGSFRCDCPNGMRKSAAGVCERVNECAENPEACPTEAICVDLDDGYSCACPLGFTNPPGNKHDCLDVNECAIGMDNCTASLCVNTVGSYRCQCRHGFVSANGVCVDIDECAGSASAVCQPGKCSNNAGGFTCDCPEGYESRNGSCVNIDECNLPEISNLAAKCGENEVCVDTAGSYRCFCPNGFVTIDGKCLDVDECMSSNACLNGICENAAGNYSCTCLSGFSLHGWHQCADVNECNEVGICGNSQYAICQNFIGGYNCTCKPGSVLIDNKCQKINECVLRNISCPANSHCVATVYGHSCECSPGFRRDRLGQCVNEDECSRGTHTCSPMAVCTDTIGSFTCKCKHGYSGDGRVCNSVCDGACAKHQMCKVSEQNSPLCTCDCVGRRCLQMGQVCDSMGRTHASEKELYEFACKARETNLTVSYFSACKDDCKEILCPESHVCLMNSEINKPVCKCKACTQQDVNSGPVCSTDRVQFANKCDYIKYKCYWKDSVALSNTSICRQPINCKVGEWSQWGACSRTCGIGFQVRTRSLIRQSQHNGQCPFEMSEFGECYAGPCPDGKCRNHNCPASHICEEVNGTANCRCPNCENRGISPVCGLISNKTDTFSNYCELKKAACKINSTFDVHHEGECGVILNPVPAKCSLILQYKNHVFPDGCTSEEKLPLHKCDGGCGKSTNKCCVPLHTRKITARYRCPDSSQVIRATEVTVGCHCSEQKKYSGQSIRLNG